MKTFSRIVFAIAGLMLGLILGLIVYVILAIIFLKFNANAQDNPGFGMLILYFLPYGLVIGAVGGVFAGMMLPLKAEYKAKLEQKQAMHPRSDEKRWPPPPSNMS